MRTLRLSLIGAAILALTAGTGAALGQADASPGASADGASITAPATVSGTLEFAKPGEAGAESAAVIAHVWTSSDPRLTGTATDEELPLYDTPGEDSGEPSAVGEPVTYHIHNAEGLWTCTGTHPSGPVEGRESAHIVVLEGSGAYDGLTAYLKVDWSTDPANFTGIIFPGPAPSFAPLG